MVVLGSIEQAITAVFQGFSVVCVDGLNDVYRLYQRTATSVDLCIDPITTEVACMFGKILRPGVRYRVALFKYQLLTAICNG